MKLLVICDEKHKLQKLEAGLQEICQSIEWLNSVDDALTDAYAINVDVIVVLADREHRIQGAVLALRRLFLRTGIVVITPEPTTETTVAALNAGADACLDRRVEANEITARLRSIVRRYYGHSSSDLACGSLNLNIEAKSLTWCGTPVKITRAEYEIMEKMLLSKGDVVSRENLQETVINHANAEMLFSVDSAVSRLRNKLQQVSQGKVSIQNFRRIGYCLSIPENEEWCGKKPKGELTVI